MASKFEKDLFQQELHMPGDLLSNPTEFVYFNTPFVEQNVSVRLYNEDHRPIAWKAEIRSPRISATPGFGILSAKSHVSIIGIFKI